LQGRPDKTPDALFILFNIKINDGYSFTPATILFLNRQNPLLVLYMQKILLIVAHPALEKSRNNIRMLKAASSLENVVIRDLYELYPRFSINTRKEQEYLEQSDIIVLQHPFYWYNVPALLKQYFDMVFTNGWAYGSKGNNLHGKIMFNSFTTSGSRESYQADKHNRFPMASYLIPFNQMAHVCGMTYLPPYVLHDSGKVNPAEAAAHSKNFKVLLQSLRDPGRNIQAACEMEYLNDWIPVTAPPQLLPGT
jgi:glutathione-regulated potassium-efflux system ancillary protein KefG